MLTLEQRRLLGAFIRAHRERVRPATSGRRRRTPGLRREELAVEAGISSTWCAWLEQGRPVQASSEALGRLARALALTRAERAYLFELAGRLDPEAPLSPEIDAPSSLTDAVRAIQHPAYGLDGLWNAVCWNDAAERLFRGWLDGDNQRNLLRFVFLGEAAHRLIPEWEDRARRLLAEFRADYGHSFRDARVKSFVDELRASSELFSRAWDSQDVLHRAGGKRTFHNSMGGLLRFEQHTFTPSDRSDYKLVMLVPGA